MPKDGKLSGVRTRTLCLGLLLLAACDWPGNGGGYPGGAAYVPDPRARMCALPKEKTLEWSCQPSAGGVPLAEIYIWGDMDVASNVNGPARYELRVTTAAGAQTPEDAALATDFADGSAFRSTNWSLEIITPAGAAKGADRNARLLTADRSYAADLVCRFYDGCDDTP